MELFDYQKKGVEHLLKHDRAALWSECGLGKTVMTLTALEQMPKPVLVLAPKRVIDHTWPSEIEKWSDMSYVSLSVPAAKRQQLNKPGKDIYLINFEMFTKLVDEMGGKWPFKTVVIDESSRIKNRATKLYKALRKVAGRWERHIQLTGTPSPNGLIDLWSQLYLLDRGERLGRTLTAFRERWFNADYMGWSYQPKPNAPDEIQQRCADLCLSMLAEDHLGLPSVRYIDIPVDLPPAVMKQYKQLKHDLVLEVSGSEITALSAASLANKLLQLTAGTVYDTEQNKKALHDAKIDAVLDLFSAEPLILVYQFRHELDRLRHAYPDIVEVRDSADTIERWNRGEINKLALHPASAGHGLNLQHGGHRMVWTTPTWNLEHYIQTNARLHRTGQTKPVVIYRLVATGTIDERVLAALENKTEVQQMLMEALR